MKKILPTIGFILILAYMLLLIIPIDPMERRPGTRLSGIETDNIDVNWSLLAPRTQIYVQTKTWYGIPHSVTTTSFVNDGVLYVPCGWCETKQWPKYVARDPQVIVKVGQTLYRRRALPVTELATKHRILNQHHKDVALYRMDPPL